MKAMKARIVASVIRAVEKDVGSAVPNDLRAKYGTPVMPDTLRKNVEQILRDALQTITLPRARRILAEGSKERMRRRIRSTLITETLAQIADMTMRDALIKSGH